MSRDAPGQRHESACGVAVLLSFVSVRVVTVIGPVPWPPATVTTARVVLRQPEAQDRAAIIELFAAPEVGTYVGGA